MNMETANVKLCGICTKNDGKYQCPRCNILYCSADCYKNPSHSRCSEEFYEECVRSEMSSMEPNTLESQKKMYEILKRLNDNFDCNNLDEEQLDSDDDVDEDDDLDLAERLKDINLDEADKVWEKLTDSEKRQFEELLKSNDITGILPEFEPWWDYRDNSKIVDLEEASSFEKYHKHKCPEIDNKRIIPFCKLSKTPPASTVFYNVANVLAAYVFTVRYFNGDYHDCVDESTASIIKLSKNLLDNENYFDFESAVKSVFLEVTNCEFFEGSVGVSDIIKSDVKKISEGPDINESNRNFYLLSALSDIHKLFSKAVKNYNTLQGLPGSSSSAKNANEFSKRFPESGISAFPSLPKLKIKNCLKKIEYYMSWSKEFYNNSLQLYI